MLGDALFLLGGYNTTLVTVGSALLGFAAGITGTFLFLRKRSLLGDAISHSTLPGIGIAFIVMVALGGDGRNLAGLLIGSAATAALGLHAVQWITRKTRLGEDAAIGAVLSVSFGVGIVLLTVIQGMGEGRPAGLEGFLLGSTAGMLFSESLLIAAGAAVVVAAVIALRRPLAMVAFDPEYSAAAGIPTNRVDWAMMGLVTVVTIVGLKVVGLILIVALLIIPPVAARFWSERAGSVTWISGFVGGASGYFGSALSASAPALPTGPLIVLVAFGIFVFSLLFAPARGVLASLARRRKFRARVRMRQALLSLAQGDLIEGRAPELLLRAGFAHRDGSATELGMEEAVKILRDEKRWRMARSLYTFDGVWSRYDGLASSESVMTADQLAEIDRRLGEPEKIPA